MTVWKDRLQFDTRLSVNVFSTLWQHASMASGIYSNPGKHAG